MPFSWLANIADKALYTAKNQGRNRSVVMDVRSLEPQSNVRVDEGITRPEARALMQREAEALSGTATG
jgi:hypothetical protein